MKTTPPELNGYEIDDVMAESSRVVPRAGWLVVLFSIIGISACVYYHLRIPAIICIIMFVVSFAFSIYIQQFRKRQVRCRHCGGLMSVIDANYPEKELVTICDRNDDKDKPFKSSVRSSFMSQAGIIYMIWPDECESSGYTFYRLYQRWYACKACTQCFLGEKLIYSKIGRCSTDSTAESMRNNLMLGDTIA